MKHFTFCSIVALMMATSGAFAQNENSDIIMLDLSKATPTLTFDDVNGMWNDTFDDDTTEIESQVFSIVHGSYADWNTWWGFTASNATDNAYQANTLLYQYSNMAKGGILLNDDGSIKTNEFGAPVTGSSMPYLVGFPKSEIVFNSDKSYEVIGTYVNLNSYTFYSILYGDGYARAFTEGDELILTIHGVDANENETTVDITLASFQNGSLTAATNWKYVDLSNLGCVEEIYFTMSSTDSGQYGMNTPSYFCLDKLMVREISTSSINSQQSLGNKGYISYDKINKEIILPSTSFAAVYNTSGNMVISSTDKKFIPVNDLPAGVYIVKCGNDRLKFVR